MLQLKQGEVLVRGYVFIFVVFLFPTILEAAEQLDKYELLELYRKTQDSLQSFASESIDRYKFTYKSAEGLHKDGLPGKQNTKFYQDKDRVDFRSYVWSDLENTEETTLTDKTFFRNFMWDGDSFYQYRGRKGFGTAFIKKNDRIKNNQVGVIYGGAPLLGMYFGDDRRVDSILQEANNISIRDEMEDVSGSLCYVLDAKTVYGKYTVWIDPEHGYNIAKAKVQKNEDDIIWGGKVMKGNSSLRNKMSGIEFSLDYVQFKKIDDVWVPMEAKYQCTKIFDDGRKSIFHQHHKRTSFDLNPDFEKIGAFVPDIDNGTRVFLENVKGIDYTWQDGKLVSNMHCFD